MWLVGSPISWVSIGLAVYGALVMRTRHFRDEYKIHVKDLVNTIYNKVTNNGNNLVEPDFFGSVDNSRPNILAHFFTYKKKIGVDLHDVFFKIAEARSNKDLDKERELKKQLNDGFLKIYEKVNHSIDSDFGFCFECVSKKTKIPYFNKHKLKKIKT